MQYCFVFFVSLGALNTLRAKREWDRVREAAVPKVNSWITDSHLMPLVVKDVVAFSPHIHIIAYGSDKEKLDLPASISTS